MSSAITQKQLTQLAELIRNWPIEAKLQWIPICGQAKKILGYIPSRPALSNKPILANAYKTRKAEIKLRYATLASVPNPKSMPAAVDQIIRLKQENEQLKAEINLMGQTAQLFIHNASLHGLTKEQLTQPLPKLNRRN